MVRMILVAAWMATLVGGVKFWYDRDSGADEMQALRKSVEVAAECEAREDWKAASEHYNQAILDCPSTAVDLHYQLRVKLALTHIHMDDLPNVRLELASMISEAIEDQVTVETERQIREAYAKASFDIAWQLRLEGTHEDTWREPALVARQQYQYLAKQAMETGDDSTVEYQANLERAVRLARVDVTVLAGMPFPSNCWSTSQCEKRIERARRRRSGADADGREALKPKVQDAAGT